ncbi:hypothetical protein [Paenibacillus humicus]|uniref:hypothetical protein n=1 Tax=Paenibacillus humicus TaxID=412861 RepID=UPI000FD752C6|nr:hypothetical protein [Paenibacillus humicus]
MSNEQQPGGIAWIKVGEMGSVPAGLDANEFYLLTDGLRVDMGWVASETDLGDGDMIPSRWITPDLSSLDGGSVTHYAYINLPEDEQPKASYKEGDRVVHDQHGEGDYICTASPLVAVVHFEESGEDRNVFVGELRKRD